MSSSTCRTSAPSSISTITLPMPSEAVEMICLMPSTPWMASSIRTQTASSTSSGAAPRYGTSTRMRSSVISGKTSDVTCAVDRKPPATRNAIRRLAATGLRANHAIVPFIARSFHQTGLRPEPPASVAGTPAPRAAPAEARWARLTESAPFYGADPSRPWPRARRWSSPTPPRPAGAPAPRWIRRPSRPARRSLRARRRDAR